MNIRKIVFNVVILLFFLTAVTITACASPKFEVTNMVISPNPVGAGDEVTITVDVTNVGNAEGNYTAILKVSDETIDTHPILLRPGVAGKVSFIVVENKLGTYEIKVGELITNLTVVKPAKLELDAPIITPAEVLPGEDVSITINASNTGEAKGTFEVDLIVDGEKSQTKEVTLAAGETSAVVFTLTLGTAGMHNIGVDGFKESIMVLESNQFQLSSLRFSPTEAVLGQDVLIEVDVLNLWEDEGTHTVSLEVNGKSVESKEVKIEGGSTVTVSFVIVNDFGGNYQISVNELNGTLLVSGPRYDGRITIVNPWNIQGFDEALGSSPESSIILQLTNEELIRGDWAKGMAGGYGTGETTWTLPIDSLEYKMGYIAESWEISEPDRIVFKIRNGIHYALNQNSEASRLVNGRELTAYDVAFSLERVISDSRSYIYKFNPMLRQALISAIDQWAVMIDVPPDAISEALQYFGDFVSIVPPEVVAKYGDMGDWRNSVGTGPFMLTDYVDSVSATLERNYNYWMTDPVGLGKGYQLPYVDSIRLLIIPDSSTRLAALRTGKIDQLLSIPGDDILNMEQRAPGLLSIEIEDNSNPASVRYNYWWPWVKNYNGELTIGYYNTIWPQYVWLDQDMKKSMGY